MKKLAALLLVMCMPACAIGKLQDAAEALEEAEEKIHNLAVAECMSKCSEEARDCFDQANGVCVDDCEVSHESCMAKQDSCIMEANEACSVYDNSHDYFSCMIQYQRACDGDCDQKMSDCSQGCGDMLSDCFFKEDSALEGDVAYSQCVSNCVDEMERTLKEIDL
jgi:hypothetical protein